MLTKIRLLLLVCLLAFGGITAQESELQQIDSRYFKRLYQLNDSLYRSEQPSRKGFRELESRGIKTVINFRRKKDDQKKAAKTSIRLEKLPLKAAELTEADIVNALRLIQEAEKPVLIHCWHGSDRTGAISAAYRIVVEAWPAEKAIEELRRKELGYHEKWYPNVVELLGQMDVEAIRDQLRVAP